MTSRFSGDLFYGASSTSSTGAPPPEPSLSSSIGGTQSHLFRQHHHPDLQIYGAKRSFTHFQNYPSPQQQQQQQILNLQLLQQQHQQQQQGSSVFQHQYLMRSVKPRTGSYRFGLPVYHHQQLPTLSSFNLSLPNSGATGFSPYPNLASGQFGLANLNQNTNPVRTGEPENEILNTLQELEKELLNDDEDENQEASVITNSEWSDTLNNLMSSGSDPGLEPNPTNQVSMSTSGSNNNNNNNGSMISPSPTSSTSSSCCSTSASPATSPSIRQLITEAAGAISDGKVEPAVEVLSRLAQLSNANGTPEQRLGFYMCHALRSRACPGEYPPRVDELYSKDQRNAMYTLFDVSPCFKFGILAANLVMLEAITSSMHENFNTHVIDFNVGNRGQYMHLLRALGERGAHLRHCNHQLRITVVETEVDSGCKEVVESMKDEVLGFAERVGVRLKFDVVTRSIHELTRDSLGCEGNESLVVNFAYILGRVADESVSMENLRDELLRRVKRLNPRAVTLVEQEMNVNTAPFLTRVNESCSYFGALFDALEAGLPRDSPDRAWVEEGLGRKMRNVVACEGRDRVERAEVFGKWKARMGMAGFEMKPLCSSVVESMRVKLNSGRVGNPGFSVKEESGGVGFGWMGRTLTVASSWR